MILEEENVVVSDPIKNLEIVTTTVKMNDEILKHFKKLEQFVDHNGGLKDKETLADVLE